MSAPTRRLGAAGQPSPADVPRAATPRTARELTNEELDPLVRAAGRHDQAAIARLLELLRPMVVRYCRARIGGRYAGYLSADDVAQDVFIAVLKALPRYEDRGGSFLYLVHAIAANRVADAFRFVARTRSDPVAEPPERPPRAENEPESEAIRHDLGGRLRELLARLAPMQQEIVTLRVVVGLSAQETAEMLGISAGNVRVTQFRALAKLRDMIEGEDFR